MSELKLRPPKEGATPRTHTQHRRVGHPHKRRALANNIQGERASLHGIVKRERGAAGLEDSPSATTRNWLPEWLNNDASCRMRVAE